MQTYLKFALPLAVVTSVLTLGVNALMVLVIGNCMLDPKASLPFTYYQFLHLPFFSLFLPLIAALALIPVGLKLGLGGAVTWPTLALTEHDVAPTSAPVLAAFPTPAEPPATLAEPLTESQYRKAA